MGILDSHNTVITLDDANGTPRNISGTSNKVDIGADINIGSYFTFADRYNHNLYGGVKLSGNLTILEAPDALGAHQILRDLSVQATTPIDRTLTVDTPNSATGGLRYTGEAKFSKIDLTSKEAGKGDPPMCQAAFEIDGALTISILA
jgi:hypothetical protein